MSKRASIGLSLSGDLALGIPEIDPHLSAVLPLALSLRYATVTSAFTAIRTISRVTSTTVTSRITSVAGIGATG